MVAVWYLLRKTLLPRSTNLLSLALWVAVAGVAVGVTQLMVVLAIMSGFLDLFSRNYTKITSELIVIPRAERKRDPEFSKKLKSISGIAAITPTGLAQGMILREGSVGGVVLEGVQRSTTADVTPWETVWKEAPSDQVEAKDRHWIWIGEQLAKKLKAKTGDSVNVMIPDQAGRRVLPFTVSAVTKFGIYEHDLHYARIDIDVLNDLFSRDSYEPIYKIRTTDSRELNAIASRVREEMGDIAVVKMWSDINQNVFKAVQHQKKMLFLVLEIVVALAAVNVVSLLMMSSHNRRRDVAILRAMGARFRDVVFFFLAQGAAVGLIGIVCGVGLGYVVCHLIERLQPVLLNENIYNVKEVPIRIQLGDVGLVCLAGFVLCVAFSFLPAWGAARNRPVKALRYE